MEVKFENQEEKKNLFRGLLIGFIIGLIAVAVYFVFIKKDDKTVDNGGNKSQENVNLSEYVGRYDGACEADECLEYFILKADGTAVIHYMTGDNGAFEDLSTKYSIETKDDKKVLKFNEYNEDGSYWFTDYLDIDQVNTGYFMQIRRTGPSDVSNFYQADYTGKYEAVSSDPEEKEYFILNEDGTATVHVMTGDNGAYDDYTVKYSFSKDEQVLTFESYNGGPVPGWNVLDNTGDQNIDEYTPRNIDQTPSALDLKFKMAD